MLQDMTVEQVHLYRSTQEVFEDHLRKRKVGLVEEDITLNFAPDVVLLTCTGIYHGHEGVRQSAQILQNTFLTGLLIIEIN